MCTHPPEEFPCESPSFVRRQIHVSGNVDNDLANNHLFVRSFRACGYEIGVLCDEPRLELLGGEVADR